MSWKRSWLQRRRLLLQVGQSRCGCWLHLRVLVCAASSCSSAFGKSCSETQPDCPLLISSASITPHCSARAAAASRDNVSRDRQACRKSPAAVSCVSFSYSVNETTHLHTQLQGVKGFVFGAQRDTCPPPSPARQLPPGKRRRRRGTCGLGLRVGGLEFGVSGFKAAEDSIRIHVAAHVTATLLNRRKPRIVRKSTECYNFVPCETQHPNSPCCWGRRGRGRFRSLFGFGSGVGGGGGRGGGLDHAAA